MEHDMHSYRKIGRFRGQLASIYRALGDQHVQLRQLSSAVKRSTKQAGNETQASNLLGGIDSSPLIMEPEENQDPEALDIFYDCGSRFSVDDVATSVHRLNAKFPGSPYYHFENSEAFFPQEYTTEGLFSQPLIAFTIVKSKEHRYTQDYFLLYAKTPTVPESHYFSYFSQFERTIGDTARLSSSQFRQVLQTSATSFPRRDE